MRLKSLPTYNMSIYQKLFSGIFKMAKQTSEQEDLRSFQSEQFYIWDIILLLWAQNLNRCDCED